MNREEAALIREAGAAYADAMALIEEGRRRQAIADAGEPGFLAQLAVVAPHARPKRKKSHKARKRSALRGYIRLDAGAPIISQVRDLGD